MKTPRILALSLAAQLATIVTSHAQTWDGAGANGGDLDWTFVNNWNPNGLPLNNGTAIIIFASLTDNNPGPNLDANWSVSSVTFSNTAGAFVLGSTGGFTLTVGAGGIVNNDAQTMTFTHAVSMSGLQTINASAGGLTFTSDLTLGGGLSGGNIVGNFPVTINNGGSLGGISVDVGSGADGALVVDGATSSAFFGSGPVPSEFGSSGATGTGTFSNGSLTTFFADVDIGVGGAGSVGVVQVLSDAGFGVGSDLRIGTDGTAGSSGTLTVNGVGSTASSGTLAIGAGAGSTGALNVQNSGVFTAGTGAINVGVTGTIAITGGTFNANGNMTLNGQMTRDGTGDFNLAAGRILTVQGGGDVTISGAFTHDTASTITITGTGSTLTTTSNLTLSGDSVTNVLAGADLSTGTGDIVLGSATNSTISVDGAGSTLVVDNLLIGLGGGTGVLTFSNGSSGAFSAIGVDDSTSAATNGTLSIQSGADVTGTSLEVASNAFANSGTATVNGAGSTLTVTGAGTTIIGATSASTGILNVQSSGTFTSGTGAITIGATGTVAIAGGIFNANGNMTVNGQVTNDDAGDFNLAAGRVLTVQNGGDVIFAGSLINDTASAITVTGAGSTLSSVGLFLRGGSNTNVLAGGSLSGGAGAVGIGEGTDGTVTVIGSGSTFSGGALDVGFNSATGILTFSNGSAGTFTGIDVASTNSVGTVGILNVQSGADVSGTSLDLANGTAATTGTVTITGAGSTLTISGIGGTTIGAGGVSVATLNVQNGGTFTSGTGAFSVGASGTVNIDGGTLTANGQVINSGTFNFNSGALNLLGTNSLLIGTGGLLGTDLTLLSNRQLTVAGTTTIDFTRTLTLDGGTLRTGALVNNGTLDFQRGTLGITGAGGLNIGSGVLGANVVLGIGATLEVTNNTIVSSGAVLTTNGGNFLTGGLLNNGLIEHRSGVFSVTGGLPNQAGGDIFVERTLSVGGSFTNQSGAQLVLLNGTGRVQGAGSLSNSGLVRGDGTVALGFTNAAGGEVRGESGKTLRFTGTAAPNAGTISLQGGTVEFTGALTNSLTGFISGRGALRTGGLTNNGVMAFSGGNMDLHGDVTNAGGARIVTSGGGSVTTFFDDVTHNGLEIFTGANASTVFFGDQTGAGPFTGTGTVYFNGDLQPGNSPATVSYGGDLVFGGTSSLTLEIGGLSLGAQYDHLAVAGTLHADGILAVNFLAGYTPQFGDSFDFIDAGAVVGSFDAIDLPTLEGDLAWDASQLQTTGEVRVIPEPGVGLLLASALALLGMRRRKVGEVCNLARPDGRRWQDGAERERTLSSSTASLRSPARGFKPRLR